MTLLKLFLSGLLSFWWSSMVIRFGALEKWSNTKVISFSFGGAFLIGLLLGLV